jgi:hypothetical protein
MGCRLTFKLLSESQEGNIGNDWRYVVEVKVFNQGLAGKGKIKVKKHQLDSGDTIEPHGSPEPLVIDAGDCSGELKVNFSLTATEVDLFINDSGTIDKTVTLTCPGPDSPPVTEEILLAVGVRESPGLANEVAVFTLVGELEVACG